MRLYETLNAWTLVILFLFHIIVFAKLIIVCVFLIIHDYDSLVYFGFPLGTYSARGRLRIAARSFFSISLSS